MKEWICINCKMSNIGWRSNCCKCNSQLPKGEKSRKDVQGKREDAPNNQNGDGVISKVVDSSSHLPHSSSADNKFANQDNPEEVKN
jgi:hypothetical protein